MNGTIPAGTRSPLETRLLIIAGWLVAIGILVFYIPPAAAVMGVMAAWRALTLQPKGRHAIRHGRPATR